MDESLNYMVVFFEMKAACGCQLKNFLKKNRDNPNAPYAPK